MAGNGLLSESLDRIGVEHGMGRARLHLFGEPFDGQGRAGDVVHLHEARDRGLRIKPADGLLVDPAPGIDPDHLDDGSEVRERPQLSMTAGCSSAERAVWAGFPRWRAGARFPGWPDCPTQCRAGEYDLPGLDPEGVREKARASRMARGRLFPQAVQRGRVPEFPRSRDVRRPRLPTGSTSWLRRCRSKCMVSSRWEP